MSKKITFTILLLAIISFLHYNFPYALGDNNNKAYLILYTLILLSYTFNLGRTSIFRSFNFQYAVIWILISLTLIIGYSFKQRIISELLPNQPSILADKSFLIKTSRDGHYHIEVLMNGKNFDCMVDTGATNIAIDAEIASSIGIKPSELSFSNRTQTANGIIYSANATVSLMEIAGIMLNDVNVSVNNTDMNGCLLGLSFLNKMSKISIENGVMTLTPQKQQNN